MIDEGENGGHSEVKKVSRSLLPHVGKEESV